MYTTPHNTAVLIPKSVERVPMWGSEFTTKAAALQVDSADFAAG
jgi:hypothetical protein